MSYQSLKFFILCLLVCFISCDSAPLQNNGELPLEWGYEKAIAPADDRNLSEAQRNAYQNDAELLTLQYVLEHDSSKIQLPNPLIDTYYNALVHIHNTDLPEVALITGKYNIHIPGTASRELLVTFDDDQKWANAWRSGRRLTDNELIDDLMNTYSLSLQEYHEWKSFTWDGASLISEDALNHYALGAEFSRLPEIRTAGPNTVIGGSADIEATLEDTHITFTFVFGFGDCPAGCISHHYWDFRVFQDGTVEFVKEYGSPLP